VTTEIKERLKMINEQSMIDGIRTWVECESPTYDIAANEAMLDIVAREFEGLPVSLTRHAPSGLFAGMLQVNYAHEKNTKGILILSHIDTVHPKGTLATRLPFKLDGDKLYGPGLYDMKGGAYIALEAFRSLIKAGEKPLLPVTFLYTSDEEVGSLSSRAKIEELARNAAYVLVTEPARDGGKIVTARKGVGRFILKATGRPAHAGAYHQNGRSAIRELAHQILAVESMTDYAIGVTTTVGIISGGTAANVTPEFAQMDIDLRAPNQELADIYTAKIHALKPVTPDVTLEITGGMNRPPYPKSTTTEMLFKKAQAEAHKAGFMLEDCPMTGGGSDGNFTAALGIPTLDGLGIDGAGAHTLNEHGLVSSLAKQFAVMQGLLRTLT
jgi:glutamate carboxypeptidase